MPSSQEQPLLGSLPPAHVDVSGFVTYEDPDGYVHSAPIDLNIAAGEGDLTKVKDAATAVLEGSGVDWVTRQLVGDPAMAIKHFADQVEARGQASVSFAIRSKCSRYAS